MSADPRLDAYRKRQQNAESSIMRKTFESLVDFAQQAVDVLKGAAAFTKAKWDDLPEPIRSGTTFVVREVIVQSILIGLGIMPSSGS